MFDRRFPSPHLLLPLGLSLIACLVLLQQTHAQNTVTGAFEGVVSNSQTGAPISGASVQFTNQLSGIPLTKITDERGHFYQGLLAPGNYRIRISAPGFQTREVEQRLLATLPNGVVPLPVPLTPEVAAVAAPTPGASAQPTTSPAPARTPAAQTTTEDRDLAAEMNTTDARRSGAFSDIAVSTLPLGATTLTRTFDELALLLPGVALPPQTFGRVAGPGVGAGVGSAGQFSVNGLRSRANNFTVDGSDNNDEDIGVRRQGFLALVPQSIESIQEYQVITLLAPAQFGRNIGAQVNAISKSGTKDIHGTIYGFFNSSQLNARNAFDTANGNSSLDLRAGNKPVLLDNSPLTVQNQSGGKDSFTLGQAGFVLGGPLDRRTPRRMFYFVSAEGQILNATQEVNFAVPTVEARGIFATGATGISVNAFTGAATSAFPTNVAGSAIFSFFPFPNNPGGIYGANTFTQNLPASGRGLILSGKFDSNFNALGRRHDFTARYNFTNDRRDIPATGSALFSSLRPRVRTQNFSTYLNTEVSNSIFNQVRLSYGRTRLEFDYLRDPTLLPNQLLNANERSLEVAAFLINAPVILNTTLPGSNAVTFVTPPAFTIDQLLRITRDPDPNSGNPTAAQLQPLAGQVTTESILGNVGQVIIAGYSPVGVDVFNFPQRRVNNTYQLADIVTWRVARHNIAFGVDMRRSEANSELPRNFRPLITFYGSPILSYPTDQNVTPGPTALINRGISFIPGLSFAAAGAASGFSQTLISPGLDSHINLRYYQLNFFGQDEWRIRPNLSLSYGLRYEYNTPPTETQKRITSTFDSPELDLAPGLRSFINGRTRIYDPDYKDFGPRVGIAYSPDLFGRDRATVIRAGYGLYYDQILGAVVSQSRSVYPRFLTVNLPGGQSNVPPFVNGTFRPSLINPNTGGPFGTINPVFPIGGHRHVPFGFLNELNPNFDFSHHVEQANEVAGFCNIAEEVLTCNPNLPPPVSGVGATLPSRQLKMPRAHHYAVTVEQQLRPNIFVSAAYVGTQGRNLIRFITPNLGPNAFLLPLTFNIGQYTPNTIFGPGGREPVQPFAGVISPNFPQFTGFALSPGTRLSPQGRLVSGRPDPTIGTVNIFESSANSSYNALQLQVRGRFARGLQYNVAYTFSKAIDDVSDVFDMAGAPALPQDSSNLAAERGLANFDARHRFTYDFIYDFPVFENRGRVLRTLTSGLQLAGQGQFQTGQPFTVNSLYDVNLDGNLTDRLNTTEGLIVTGDRNRPLQLAPGASTFSLLAPVGQDGSVGRNTFRASNLLELDLAVIKSFVTTREQRLIFRMDLFNFINRANFGVPVRFLEAPGFGQSVDTVTPGRRIQFALKYSF
jgi:hypothetical protein